MKSFSQTMVEEGRTWDKVVYGEPTENKIAVGHKGMVLFNVSCAGKASHSGYPELGSSANEKLIDVLYKLKHHAWPHDDALGNTTFNIGKIQGGVAANVIPASASADLSIRVARDLQGILTYLRDVIAKSPDTSFEVHQAAVPTVLDSLEGSKFEEIVVKYVFRCFHCIRHLLFPAIPQMFLICPERLPSENATSSDPERFYLRMETTSISKLMSC